MRVLSIQSQTVLGHVGNSAAAFALQRLGVEALALPTTIYSHHPGRGGHKGRALAGEEIDALMAKKREARQQ